MDEFQGNIDTFLSTIYGSEMRDSLGKCFDALYETISDYGHKIDDIRDKIIELEGGSQNANI